MKTLNVYVSKSFVMTFLMSIGVLTFGMTGVRLVKVFDSIANGLPVKAALLFILYILPIALSFTIPWAALVSIMLVFGRMSADNEITAMRACGISILQIVSPIIIMTFALTCLCLYLQLDVGPKFAGKADALMKGVAVTHPLALITPGVPIEFESFKIYIDAKEGENTIKDIQVFKMSGDGKTVEQDVTAALGLIQADPENQTLSIILQDATIIAYEGGDSEAPRRSFTKQMSFPIEYGKKFNRLDIGRKAKYLTYKEIFARSILEKRRGQSTCGLEVELNQRVALALSPIAFLLLGMPMAIRTSRRETSIGLFLSVILAGFYFGAVLVSDALQSRPEFFPQYLVWLPPALYQIAGAFYLFKIARR